VNNRTRTLNRAVTALQSGDFQNATRLCRKLLRQKSNDRQVLALLGIVLMQSGQADEAIEAFGRITRLAPDDPEAWAQLGRACLGSGAMAQAVIALERAVALRDDHGDAWQWLALARIRLGATGEAMEAFAKAATLTPENPTIRYNHCLALVDSGQGKEAEKVAREALLSHPDQPELQHALGIALLIQERQIEAVRVLRQAHDLRPDDAALLCDLGGALASIGENDTACDLLQQALQKSPSHLVGRQSLFKVLRNSGRVDEALTELEQLARLPGYRGNAALDRAELLGSTGHHDEAAEIFTPLLDSADDGLQATELLARSARKLGRDDEAIERIMRQQRTVDYDTAEEAVQRQLQNLDYALGDLLEARADHGAAFASYRQANQRQGESYDRTASSGLTDRIIATYTAQRLQELPRADLRSGIPVFIVGMPRTGTSLLEQMLDSHPAVYGAGELAAIHNLTRDLALDLELDFPELADSLDQERLERLAHDHVDHLKKLGGTARRVTDKMPENFRYLGIIARLLPDAKVIHCRRTPQDMALSIYFQNFKNRKAHGYAYDLGDIGFEYRQYLRLMAHWEEVQPLPMLAVDYERVVAEPEAATRELCAFLGIDWDPAMLRYHESRRVVVTASQLQVREKLYTRSIKRWESYREHLVPFEAELAKPLDMDQR